MSEEFEERVTMLERGGGEWGSSKSESCQEL